MRAFSCGKCIQSLEEIGDVYANLWTDLCQFAVLDEVVNLKEDNGLKYELMWLEELGYIVTRETDTVVQIKVKEPEKVDGGLMFCNCGAYGKKR